MVKSDRDTYSSVNHQFPDRKPEEKFFNNSRHVVVLFCSIVKLLTSQQTECCIPETSDVTIDFYIAYDKNFPFFLKVNESLFLV